MVEVLRLVGRMEDRIIFFAWGGGTMSHPPVSLIEDDCAA